MWTAGGSVKWYKTTMENCLTTDNLLPNYTPRNEYTREMNAHVHQKIYLQYS